MKKLMILVFLFVLTSYGKGEKLKTREEYEQIIEQQQKEIESLKQQLDEKSKKLIELSDKLLALKGINYHSSISESTKINNSSKIDPVEKIEIITEKPKIKTQNKAIPYKIIETEDLSHKIYGKLSDYNYQEIDKLPLVKKMCYKILVSPKIKEAQVKPTIENILDDIITKDNDIDEITLFIYSDREIIDSQLTYDVARATWAALGKLGNITTEIAKNNIRSNYTITIDIKDNLEEYLQSRNMPEKKFGLTETTRRQIYKEIIEAEDKAYADADKKYPSFVNYKTGDLTESEFRSLAGKYNNYQYEQKEQYRKIILKKYKITEGQLKDISFEAHKKNWPMPNNSYQN